MALLERYRGWNWPTSQLSSISMTVVMLWALKYLRASWNTFCPSSLNSPLWKCMMSYFSNEGKSAQLGCMFISTSNSSP